MTAARQNRPRAAGALIAAALVLTGGGPIAGAATTERVVIDRHTGLALGGIDPVSYFVDGAPRPGAATLELLADGAVWRFRNTGNRAAFAADPDVYRPRFGGYDPVAAAAGKPVAGLPSLWLVVGQRLYLFSRDDTRAAFAADPGRFIAAADRHWPARRADLAE